MGLNPGQTLISQLLSKLCGLHYCNNQSYLHIILCCSNIWTFIYSPVNSHYYSTPAWLWEMFLILWKNKHLFKQVFVLAVVSRVISSSAHSHPWLSPLETRHALRIQIITLWISSSKNPPLPMEFQKPPVVRSGYCLESCIVFWCSIVSFLLFYVICCCYMYMYQYLCTKY